MYKRQILFIFTGKSMLYTVIAGAVGLIFYLIFSAMGLTMVGIVITVVFALIGFITVSYTHLKN